MLPSGQLGSYPRPYPHSLALVVRQRGPLAEMHRLMKLLCLAAFLCSMVFARQACAQTLRLHPPSARMWANSTLPQADSQVDPQTRPSREADQKARESEKLGSYLLWLDRMERERSALRDTGRLAVSTAQACEQISAFERATLAEHPPRPEKLLNGHRFYWEALSLEAVFSMEILRALRDGESSRAGKLAKEGSSAIDRRLGQMRRELSWYFRQRNLGAPPVIAPSTTGSYFGYLAGHAPH